MTMPFYLLTVATSADALISPTHHTSTANWVSAEEQDLFFADISEADWCIMGRHTHQAADKPDRHRIVFSTTKAGWQRPTQLWLNPDGLAPDDLAERVEEVRPLSRGLILGGKAVHDWFLAAHAIHRVHLTIEPLTFGTGVPIFGDQTEHEPIEVFQSRGFRLIEERVLNRRGTRFCVLRPE